MSEAEPRDFHDAETVTSGFSFVWLVPLIALALTIGVAWKTQADRGPLVEILLDSATGVESGKTLVKRRDVQIGVVEDVGFTDDMGQVVVSVRLDKKIAPFIDDSAKFWVVSPQVTLEGISGLETVLSGSYIEASWDREIGEAQYRFTALENPPLTPPDTPGKRVRLIAEDGGSMSVGAPVFYKRIQVGRIEAKTLTPDGEAVVFDLFVDAPHDRRLTEGSRFWNTSGVSVELGAQGAKLKLESFSSFLRGGITFDTVALGGRRVDEYHLYRLFDGEQEARASIFDDDYGAQIRMTIEFEGSIRGLQVGAPVELRGYRVGEVLDVIAAVDNSAGVPSVSLVVTILLQPSRLGLPRGEAEESLTFLKTLVRNGMRAKLASASLITSSLYIELVDRPGEPQKEIDETARPYPRLPSVASDLDDLAASAEGVLNRINALPIEELLESATALMDNISVIAASEDTRAIPGEITGLLGDARGVVGGPELAQATGDLAAMIASAREIVEAMQAAELAVSLKTALDVATGTLEGIGVAVEGAPPLIENLTRLSGTAADLPLGELVASATGVLTEADALLASEGTQALPAELAGTMADLRSILADLREADAATALADAIREAGGAAEAIRVAATDAPDLIANLTAFSATARDLPLAELLDSATTLIANADRVVGAESVRQLPEDLSAALADIRALLADLRAADAATNLATALAEAGEAAKSIRLAADTAPALMADLSALGQTANALPLDDLVGAATQLVQNADALVSSDGIARLPEDVAAALGDVRVLLADLRDADAAANLALALERAGEAAVSIEAAAAGAPELIARLTEFAENARDLPLDDLVAAADTMLRDTSALVRSDEVRAVPASISATLANIDGLLREIETAGITARLAQTLDAATATAGSITAAAQGVPAVLAQIDALAAQIRTLPLDQAVERVTALVASMDRILTAPGADELPEAVTAAFDQIRVTVADLQRRDVPKNFNETLVSFNAASLSFTELSAALNALMPQVGGLAARADSVLSEFDVGSELNYEAITTIREIRDAARAITALVATIERRPNSLILGK